MLFVERNYSIMRNTHTCISQLGLVVHCACEYDGWGDALGISSNVERTHTNSAST